MSSGSASGKNALQGRAVGGEPHRLGRFRTQWWTGQHGLRLDQAVLEAEIRARDGAPALDGGTQAVDLVKALIAEHKIDLRLSSGGHSVLTAR